MLRAFIDDSTSNTGDRRLFLAGYVNWVEAWERFSESWEAELRAHPAIDYLKMAEANSVEGQFQGWSFAARDQKLERLARIIRHFNRASFECSVSRSDYVELVAPVAPYGMRDPFSICFHFALNTIAKMHAESGLSVPVTLVFDEQEGLGVDAAATYEAIKRIEPSVASAIGGTPTFENDRALAPLQAADMLAWHVRREAEARPNDDRLSNLVHLRGDGTHFMRHLDRSALQSIANGFKRYNAAAIVPGKREWREVRENFQKLRDWRPSLLARTRAWARRTVARLFGP